MTVGAGELHSVALRVGGFEITVWKEYSFNSDFFCPTDGWRFVVGDEVLEPDLLKLLVPGQKVQLVIDSAVQSTGYIDIVDPSGDRNSGNQIVIEGRDTLSPVVDTQIDPSHRYPDKTPLDKLIEDTLKPFGFSRFEISNEANVNVAANKAIPRRKKHKKLSQYPIPKNKPQHNESFWQFLTRITQRYKLWIWATVDGEGVVVSQPDIEQEPRYQIRRKLGGATNNILRGGVRLDATGQPSYIVATGNVPPREVMHTKMRVVADSPYFGKFATPGAEQNAESGVLQESLTFSSIAAREHRELFTWTTFVPAPPISFRNPFASIVAKPRYLKDTESKTIEELTNFAQRQMALYMRKAIVGRYTILGHKLDGQPIQVDTVIDVDDERSNWKGPMYVVGRTFNKSRSGGTTTDLELVPLTSMIL